jgi:hypothetical protein
MTFLSETNGIISNGNTSTANLSGLSVFIGVSELNAHIDVMVSLKSDTNGTLYMDFSNDNVIWDSFPVLGFQIVANIHEVHTAIKGRRYFRIKFVNKSTESTTNFRVYTYYGIFKAKNLPLHQNINGDSDSITVRSIQVGTDPTGTYINTHSNGYAFQTNKLLNSDISFNSDILTINNFSQLQTELYSDVSGELHGTWYDDEFGTNIIRSFVFPYQSLTLETFSSPVFGQYLRYTYINGASAQNVFSLSLKFLTNSISGQVLGTESFISNNMVANLGRNIIVGRQPDGDYINNPADGTVLSYDKSLNANEVYMSSWMDSDGWNLIKFFISSDVISAYKGLIIEFTNNVQATDPLVKARKIYSFTSYDIALGYKSFSLAPLLDGFRFVYVNGPNAQSSFYVDIGLNTNSSNNSYNEGQALQTTNFYNEVALNNIAKYSISTTFGRVENVVSGSDIWESGGTYTGQPLLYTPEKVNIVSNNSTDKDTRKTKTKSRKSKSDNNTGARSIQITGLKTVSSNEYESEDISLNGTTNVSSTNTWYRINKLIVLDGGSDGQNNGVISCTSEVSDHLFGTINIGYNHSNITAYTVPYGKTILIKNVFITLTTDTKSSKSLENGTVTLRARNLNSNVYNAIRTYDVQSGTTISDTRLGGLTFLAGTDIKFTANARSSDNITVNASFEYVLIDI